MHRKLKANETKKNKPDTTATKTISISFSGSNSRLKGNLFLSTYNMFAACVLVHAKDMYAMGFVSAEKRAALRK